MTRHASVFLTAALLAATASPASAQDGGPAPLLEASAEPVYPLDAYPEPAHAAGAYFHENEAGAPYARHHYPAAGLPPVPSVGYTEEDRRAWLDDCRAEYYGEGERDGGIIGGILGAVTGGIIGNRVADGERLGGTLLGAGVGGLAGLAIGAAIGAATDREEIDECEAYLRRYESGYRHGWPKHPYPYGYPTHGYPVMMVPVKIETRYVYSEPIRHEKDIVVEEWIEEDVVETKIVSQPTKYVKPKAEKGKTVRSSK